MVNEKEVLNKIFIPLYNKVKNKDCVGNGTTELISVTLHLCPDNSVLDFGCKKTNQKYVDKELKWYNSQSLSIINYVDDITIWNNICTKDEKKEVNSNYGWCIFSEKNYSQYDNCINELVKDQFTRNALMYYTRPSMHEDKNRNGMSDAICTIAVQVMIRNNKLIYVVNQRSMDIIFGFFNDFAWHCHVYNKLLKDLHNRGVNVMSGEIAYNINSAHVYERHYDLLNSIIESNS
jgi:thymidylate synthase